MNNISDHSVQEGMVDLLGSKLRHFRRMRGFTLLDIAKQIGCSESLLSKIERNHITPSLPTLHKLAEVLGINIAALFSDKERQAVATYNYGERPRLMLGSKNGKIADVQLERMVPYAESRLLDANLHVVPPGGGSSGTYSHHGEEVGFVVSGYIELVVDSRSFLLRTGSSFFFNSSLPHSYTNIGAEEARIVWVNSFRK